MNSPKYKNIIAPSLIAAVVIGAVVIGIGFGINKFKSNEKINDLNIAKKSPTPVTPLTKSESSDFASTKDISKFVDTIEERLELLSNTRDLSSYDQESISAAINDPRLWDFSTQASPDDLPLDDIEKQDGRSFFNANPARVVVSLSGDVLEIALPGGERLLLDVEQVGVLENGLVTLSGSIQGEDGTFNISQGDNITAGHINTSTDTYSFEVFGDTGWIHQSGALFTGELPPVIDDVNTVVNSTLGNQGEQIFAKGNNEPESVVHNHSQGNSSHNGGTSTSDASYTDTPIEE